MYSGLKVLQITPLPCTSLTVGMYCSKSPSGTVSARPCFRR